jgi:hypothetical protein
VQFIRNKSVPPEKSFAILSYETAKLGPGREPLCPQKIGVYNRRWRVAESIIEVCTCPGCGQIVSEFDDEEALIGAVIPGKRAERFVGSRGASARHRIPLDLGSR